MSFSEEIRATGNFQRQFQKEKRRIQLQEVPKADIESLQTHVIDVRSHIHFANSGTINNENIHVVPIGPHQHIFEPDYKAVRLRTLFRDVHGADDLYYLPEFESLSHDVAGNFTIYNALRLYDQAGVSGQNLWFYVTAQDSDSVDIEEYMGNLWKWRIGFRPPQLDHGNSIELNLDSSKSTVKSAGLTVPRIQFLRADADMNVNYNFTTTSFSVCFWIYPTEVSGGTDNVVAYRHSNVSNQWSIEIDTNGDSKLWARMEIGGVEVSKRQYDTPLVANQWYFVVLTWDSQAQVLSLKVNDVGDTSSSKTTSVADTSDGMYFGGYPDCVNANTFRGYLTGITYYQHQPSIKFDSSSDQLQCGNDATLWSQALTKFSFSMWVYPTDLTSTVQDYLRHGGSGGGRFRLETTGVSGEIKWNVRNAANTTDATSVLNTIVANQWQHIVCTYDNSLASQNVKAYRNAVLATDTGDLTDTLNLSADLNLGGGSFGFRGWIADFRWWTTKALSAKEVSDLYNLKYTSVNPDYWLPLQEGTGTFARDIIAPLKNKTATLSNSSWDVGKGRILSDPEKTNLYNYNTISETNKPLRVGDGQYGNSPASLDFDGVDDGASLGSHADLWSQGLNKFSFSFWLYPTAAWDGANRLCARHGNVAHGFECDLDSTVSGQIFLICRNSVNTSFEANNGSGGERVVLNNWNFITCVYDNSLGSANVKIYVNAVLGSQTADLTETLNLPSTVMELGGPSADFKGQMQDFRWWNNVALTQTEINTIYAKGYSGYDVEGMDYWLPMDEGSGSTLTDRIGGKTVTISGGGDPTWSTNHY